MCMICLLSDSRNEIKHLEPSVLVVQHGAQGKLDLADTRGEILSDAVHPESDWYLYGHKNPQHAHTSLIKHSFIGNLSSLSSLLSTLSSSVFFFFVPPIRCHPAALCRLQKKPIGQKCRGLTKNGGHWPGGGYVTAGSRLILNPTPGSGGPFAD